MKSMKPFKRKIEVSFRSALWDRLSSALWYQLAASHRGSIAASLLSSRADSLAGAFRRTRL